MHDDVRYDPIKDQGQSHEPFKVGNPAIFKSYILRRLQLELTTDHGFLNYGTISTFERVGFLIFGIVFVSRDFELGTNVSCKESTVSPIPPDNVFGLSICCITRSFICLSRQILLPRYLVNALNNFN